MAWFLAPSLVKLRTEINQRYPHRDKTSDGAVGDTSHAARKSSHNPLTAAQGAPKNWIGVVRGLDIDNNGRPGERTPLVADVLGATIGDGRVHYVIWNRKIYSRTSSPAWVARAYTGANPHDKHIHISLRETVAAWSDTSPWLRARWAPNPSWRVNVPNVQRQFRRGSGATSGPISRNNGVGLIQQALNKTQNAGLVVDGYAGPATVAAWKKFEAKTGVGSGLPQVPDRASLRRLGEQAGFQISP